MKIEIDKNSGCCYGVLQAIEGAERHLSQHNTLFSLGAIVHNNTEIKRLCDKGLEIIDYSKLKTLQNETVLIRAHGEPPSTYKTAEENQITIIDCTCPVVLKLQKKIATTYQTIKKDGGAIIIFGKAGHAEVNGLIGQVNGDAHVVENLQSIKELITSGKISLAKPIALFSQTTQGIDEYRQICKHLQSVCPNVQIFNTICGQVSSRHPHLAEFANQHTVILFVSGKESSNGKILFEQCKNHNPKSYMIENKSEIDLSLISDDDCVGICGATSTPKWQLEEIAAYIHSN